MKESKPLIYLKNFIESDYTDLDMFKKACHKNINLEIYLCIPEKELVRILQAYKEQGINNAKELSSRLVNDQPAMNKTLDIYEKATVRIQQNIDNYIKYHGFKMANSAGSAEDWYTEFLIKYWYNVNFYKTRWFFPETLKKESKVKFKPMLYKDFLYQSKAVISNEKRLKAHQAASKKQDSLFKTSLDKDFKDSNKNLKDTISDSNDMSFLTSEFEVFKNRILTEIYKDSKFSHLFKKVEKMITSEEVKSNTPEGKLILAKCFLLGLDSPRLIEFVKGMSGRQKAAYGISDSRIRKREEESKKYLTTTEISNSFYNSIINTYEEDPEAEKKYLELLKAKKHRKRKKAVDNE